MRSSEQARLAERGVTANSWRMDETCIKVASRWTYLCRAVDRDGQTLDFMLSERRDLPAVRRFFKRAIATNGVPDRAVIDESDGRRRKHSALGWKSPEAFEQWAA